MQVRSGLDSEFLAVKGLHRYVDGSLVPRGSLSREVYLTMEMFLLSDKPRKNPLELSIVFLEEALAVRDSLLEFFLLQKLGRFPSEGALASHDGRRDWVVQARSGLYRTKESTYQS